MAEVGSYRIRWANVQVANGRSFSRHRMCIAERRYRWFGWWPCRNSDWAHSEDSAFRDIEHDKALRTPLPVPRIVA